ncbi:uncharacterized protein LOC135821664 [Sycon ciliatum]|uniref:uncharacterized protein LOC135821664 n=1 Tax=Sycon ciliatum TaxID=27933 RepID=UPI0031F6206E
MASSGFSMQVPALVLLGLVAMTVMPECQALTRGDFQEFRCPVDRFLATAEHRTISSARSICTAQKMELLSSALHARYQRVRPACFLNAIKQASGSDRILLLDGMENGESANAAGFVCVGGIGSESGSCDSTDDCMRGYACIHGNCADIDECADERRCPTGTHCQNHVGGFGCRDNCKNCTRHEECKKQGHGWTCFENPRHKHNT